MGLDRAVTKVNTMLLFSDITEYLCNQMYCISTQFYYRQIPINNFLTYPQLLLESKLGSEHSLRALECSKRIPFNVEFVKTCHFVSSQGSVATLRFYPAKFFVLVTIGHPDYKLQTPVPIIYIFI